MKFEPFVIEWDLADCKRPEIHVTDQQKAEGILEDLFHYYHTCVYEREVGKDPKHPTLKKIIIYGGKPALVCKITPEQYVEMKNAMKCVEFIPVTG